MSAGSGALGFGGGFARGFANQYVQNKENKRKEAREAEDKKFREFQVLHPVRIQHAEETGDWQGYQSWLSGYFPDLDKELKKGGGSPFEHLAPLLQAAPQPTTAQTQMQTDQNDAITAGTGEPPMLPSRQSVAPDTSVAGAIPDPKSMLFGQHMPSRAEKESHAIDLERRKTLAQGDAQYDVKLQMAKRLRATDPSMSVEDSLIAVGLKVPQEQFGTLTPGAGVYNKKTGEITEPASAKAPGNLPGQFGQRVLELKALHPDWDDAQIQAEAATAIEGDRAEDREARLANAESIRANRAIQQTLLRMQADAGGITPNNAAALTTQMRRDWLKAVEPFKTRQVYVAKLNEAITKGPDGKTMIQRDRNAATQTIINSFNRLLEEGNTVREGEYARSEELTPLTTWLEAKIVALQQGGGKLTDAQLESLAKEGIRIAKVTADVHEGGLRDTRTAMERQLGKYHIPPEDVFGNSTIGGQRFSATLDGKTYTFPDQSKLDAFKRQFPKAQ